ncbi:MAG: arylsulfatase [Phycisphaerales bacterium]|nr:arylsulfatase [Phycisphaerales bacterium]
MLTLLATILCVLTLEPARPPAIPPRPNIVLILADDLGYGDLGCYGQQIIKTPNLDALAASGVRFTHAYSGSPVCAPSRCSILTGRHTGHSAIRDNKELADGQQPLPADSVTIASTLKNAGYATAAIGKWGLGIPGSSGDPAVHGFDHFFGYYCQRHAHNHYPAHLFLDGQRVELEGNAAKYDSGAVTGAVYAPDRFRAAALAFIEQHRDRPFFLYFATTVPHLALQVPEDSLAQYRDVVEERPYPGGRGYIPHPNARAAYAAMVSRLDADVGALVSALNQLPPERDTLIIFTSDNGPTIDVGGADSTYFDSTAGLRGRKMDLYEGGIRVPLITAWVRAQVRGESAEPVASWDLFPTIARLCDAGPPADTDGIDLSGIIRADGDPPSREHLYWEYPSGGGWQAVRLANYKAVRRNTKANPDAPVELYDLDLDPAEANNIADSHPDIINRVRAIMSARRPAMLDEWNFK